MAGYFGDYTGYAPRTGGGFDFTRANGGNVVVPPGPQAEELKKNIDAGKMAQELTGLRASPPPATAQPQPGPAAQDTPLFTKPDGTVVFQRPGINPQDPRALYEVTPGRAATKGGLALRTQSQQGGYELDPERVQAVEQSQLRIMEARQEGAQKMAELSAERQAAAAEERAQLQREAAVVQHEQSVKEQQLTELRARHEAAEKDFLETPEKQRQAREGNTGRNIIEAIALALGSLGAGLARTPNFAQQTIESIHEREMRAEEAALRVKKEGADSLLGRLKEQMGSIDQAKLSYRAIRSRDAALRLESLAQRSSDEQQRSGLLAAAEQENQQYLKWREALERGAQGEVTKNFQMVQGSAGSGPSKRPVSLDTFKTVTGIAGDQASTNKTMADAGRVAQGEAPGQPALESIGGAVETLVAADNIQRSLAKRGFTRDNTIDDPLSGGLDAAKQLGEDVFGKGEIKKANDALQADTVALAKGMQSAFGKSDRDAEDAERMATGKASAGDRMRAAEAAEARALRGLTRQLSALPPDQQRKQLEQLPENIRKKVLNQ